MTHFDDLDMALTAYLNGEAASAPVPDELLRETLAVTTIRSPRMRLHARISAQRTGSTRSIVPGGPSVAIAFVLLALLVALLALGLGAGSPRPALRLDMAPNPVASASVAPAPAAATTTVPPAPPVGEAHRITKFPRPFTYRELTPMLLTKVSGPYWMVAFTSTGSTPYPPILRDGTWEPGAWGITISSAKTAVIHPCPLVNGGQSRVSINGREARLFLEDLRTIAVSRPASWSMRRSTAGRRSPRRSIRRPPSARPPTSTSMARASVPGMSSCGCRRVSWRWTWTGCPSSCRSGPRHRQTWRR